MCLGAAPRTRCEPGEDEAHELGSLYAKGVTTFAVIMEATLEKADSLSEYPLV